MDAEQKPADLGALNTADRDTFVTTLAAVAERSTWVQESAYERRPFASVDALWEAMTEVIAAAPAGRQIELIRRHPELAGAEARQGVMEANSTREQDRLGFTALSPDELARLTELNERYRTKFGYPCIIALHRHDDRASVFQAFEARLTNEPDVELKAELAEIGEVIRGRLLRLFRMTEVS